MVTKGAISFNLILGDIQYNELESRIIGQYDHNPRGYNKEFLLKALNLPILNFRLMA